MFLKLIKRVEWPSPHDIPTHNDLKAFLKFLAIVETATTWSPSVECLKSETNPKNSEVKTPDICTKSLSIKNDSCQ